MATFIKMLKATVFCNVMIVMFGTVVGSVQAGETISVTLHSGRKFMAEVHVRTNAQRLWLRFGQEGTSLLRPIAWDQVAFAMHGERKLTVEELKSQASTLACPQMNVHANTTAVEPHPKAASGEAPSFANRATSALRGE